MPKLKWIKITKLDAAKRQVRMALELWFADADPVSIHTLLYAALEIIDGFCKRKGFRDHFFSNQAMKETGLVRTVKDWPNFFKHGRQQELDRVLDFNPGANMVFLSACIDGLDKLGEEREHLTDSFAYWCLVHEPDFVGGLAPDHMTAEELRHLRSLSKKQFLKHILPALRKRN